MEVYKVSVDEITVGARMRSVKPDRVDALAESIAAIGLQTPISVWSTEDESEIHLVAGAHRLAAVKKLGWEDIDCILVNMSELDRRRWEIAENLHRAELTQLERSEHVAEWVRLTEQAVAEAAAASAADEGDRSGKPSRKGGGGGKGKPCQNDTVSRGGRGKKSGINQAARELNIPGKTDEAKRLNAHRAVKVSSLTEEAKQTAREVGLDDNRSALLKAAKAQKEGKDASEVLREIAAKKYSSASAAVLADDKQRRMDVPFTDDEIDHLRELETHDIREVLVKLHDLGWSGARRTLGAKSGVSA